MGWVQCNFIQTSPAWADSACGITPQNSGGYGGYGSGKHAGRRRDPEELRKQREELGILPAAQEVIQEVAARQVDRLETDAHKQFEELQRELELRHVEWQAAYLDALSEARGQLIAKEIASRLKAKMVARDEADLLAIVKIALEAAL